MSVLNALAFTPKTQKGNLPAFYKGADDATTHAQYLLLAAGKAGTDGVLDGVLSRWQGEFAIAGTDPAGNYIVPRDANGDPVFLYESGAQGGARPALVAGYSLGAPALGDTDIVHAAITLGAAGSNTGVHAAVTLTTANQTISTAITNPDVPRRILAKGSAAAMVGTVTFIGTDENDDDQTEDVFLNGSSAVSGLLFFKTVTSFIVPPYTTADTETVSIGTGLTGTAIGFTDPDFPRVLTVTGAEADQTQDVVANGTDWEDTAISDTIALNGTSTVSGVLAFKTVTSMTGQDRNDAGETVIIGTGAALGLPYRMDHDAFIGAQLGTAHEATRPTVTYDGTNVSGNTVALSTALDGSKEVVVDFIRSDAPAEFDRL